MIPDTLFTTLYSFSVAIYWHRLLANLLLIASFFVAPLVTAQTNSNDALVEIRFTQQQGLLTQEIIQLLDRQHYQHRELDDQFASDVFFRYLKLLDPQHIYFSKADLAPFNYLNRELDDLLVKGDLVPMAQLYNLLQQRRLAFIDFNLTALSKLEPMFNFELLEDISTSPFNDPRLSNLAAIKDNWRKQLKNVFINGQLDNETVDEIKQRLKKRYTSMRKRVLQVQLKDAYQAVSNSITTVTDPHTTYLSPRNVEDFNIDMSLSLEGIGAVLQRDDDYTKVVRLVVGGPADKAGDLQASDYIVGVAQDGEAIQEILGWRLDDVVDQIRGPKGTLINLQIIPGGDLQQTKKTIQIRRNKVTLDDQAAKKSVIEIETEQGIRKIGVITLPTFYMDFAAAQSGDTNYRSTTRDVYDLLQELKGESINGIVIDLRNNGGGSLREANQLTGLFIETGTTVQVRYADGVIQKQMDRNPLLAYNGPMVVLINRYSASASEIFAAAMQDYKRALIVGSQTYGKGTVQTFGDLSSGQIKFTQAKFYRVSGASTQHKGVVPDVVLPSLDDPTKVGESTQDHALKWDQVKAIDHKTYFAFEHIIPRLQAQQDLRNQRSADWQYTLAIAEHERDRPKQLSLHLGQRQQYWQEQQDWYLTHINELRLGHQLAPVTDIEDHDFDYDDAQKDPYILAGAKVIGDWIDMAH
ncbi:carboxy terminal-processing peptidase [Candidatus Njordibacter sp. Uisw_039]|jgi:carboxyl-terminal processing protease|uniref:carboxy terminal-processing peptidase n=1 Tax=Candidatus Njordibacter sp. Uisw_039 TaxID=3230972 RepID=UPI003A43B30C